MKPRVKRIPRLWCALQGLLPLESCLAAQRAESAWPVEEAMRKTEARPRKTDKSETRKAAT